MTRPRIAPGEKMNIQCDKCLARYDLDQRLFSDASAVRVKCRKCGGSIVVVRPESAEAPPESLPKPKLHLAPPPTPPAAPPLEPGMAGRMSPNYTISRAVTLDRKKMALNRVLGLDQESLEVECYRVLRTQILQRTDERGGNVVMITSALPGEGKTLTSINLALTFAKAFSQTVLLVDADLRLQRIHEILGYESRKGLVEYLMEGAPVSDLMVWPGVEKLTVISGGKTIGESSELLGSRGMKDLVEDLKKRYPDRYVLFDVAPVLAGADAISLAPLVDHIVFVVEAGRTSARDVDRALRLLPREKVLGLVLNRHKPTKRDATYLPKAYPKK